MLKEIFARKLGMTQIFDKDGSLIPVTLLEVEKAFVLENVKYPNKTTVKIGFCKVSSNRLDKIKKPILGYFNRLKVEPYRFIKEVLTTGEIEPKKEFGAEIFNEGEIVDIRGITKGRGFSGGIKRHNWHGGPQSHGSMTHRRIGSNGSNTDPGRVLRGHRMPGHYGNSYRTVKNLEIVKIDKDKNLLFVKGAICGPKGNIVKIRKVSLG